MGLGIVVKVPIDRVREPGTYWAGFHRKVAFRLWASRLAPAKARLEALECLGFSRSWSVD